MRGSDRRKLAVDLNQPNEQGRAGKWLVVTVRSVGDLVQFPTPDGKSAFAGVVRELDPEGEWALFDFNHPLAGQPCTFEVQLIGVL